MPNLAHELPPPQGQVVQFPKKERPVMSDQDEGYTPLPNFICDEGYLAVLDGDAIKCLMLLNRHISGFHLQNKGMSEALIKKVTGIKDGRTIQKYMAQLAEYNIIKIEKEKGKTNVYSLTFDDRLPTQHVGTFKGKAQHAPTQHVGTPPTQHVGGTTYMACGSIKEIYLKENSKRKDEEDNAQEPEKFSTQNRPLNFVEYHPDDKTQISFRDLCKKYPAQLDFQQQAKTNFPNHSPELIFETLKKMAQWSLDKSNHTPQKWMSIWLSTFMKNEKTDAEAAAAAKRKAARAAKAQDKPQARSRFGQYLKPQQEIRDV